jgi:hypothetical protein
METRNNIPVRKFLKSTTLILIWLFPLFSLSQPFFSVESGTRLGINTGYLFNDNLVFKGGALITYTRTTQVSNISYASTGYEINISGEDDQNFYITPLIGISHYHVTDFSKWVTGGDPVERNKTVLLTSLEIGKKFSNYQDVFDWKVYGSYYLFITKAKELFYGAGLRLFIK